MVSDYISDSSRPDWITPQISIVRLKKGIFLQNKTFDETKLLRALLKW